MRRIRSSRWAAALLILSGCSQPDARPATRPSESKAVPPPPASAPAETTELTDSNKRFQIKFRPDPFPIEAGKPFLLHVEVGLNPIHSPYSMEGPSLNVDAAMPEHRHGMNTQPRVTQAGPGKYEVKGMLLHMSGRWELYFDVVEGPVTHRATHVLELD